MKWLVFYVVAAVIWFCVMEGFGHIVVGIPYRRWNLKPGYVVAIRMEYDDAMLKKRWPFRMFPVWGYDRELAWKWSNAANQGR